ncbi:MAG: 4-(cytidine 5'-diphospho)-2-C-methyl-D-erythritol kinase [Desulfobulbus sp.]|nr:4-(cytidine 5'-diphospho)-2-C-methyl-D-erythritol kinase [Desulfobulbus sp.]
MLQNTVTVKAPAKINLSLKVLGRRDDGYHLLATHMQKVGLYDILALSPEDQGIHLRCLGGDLPEDRSNLVYRAAELFLDWAAQNGVGRNTGVALTLEKNIPIAAGLGGGSSDAAATLLGLDQMLATDCSPVALAAMGLQLGADVPFFLDPAPAALATGIGEILQEVKPLTPYQVLLVNPGFSVSTRWVYQTFALTEIADSDKIHNSQETVSALGGDSFPLLLANDLEQVTLKKFPELGHIKAEMLARGAEGALMSGSGPTVFGIFQDRQKAKLAAGAFKQQYRQTYLVDSLQ